MQQSTCISRALKQYIVMLLIHRLKKQAISRRFEFEFKFKNEYKVDFLDGFSSIICINAFITQCLNKTDEGVAKCIMKRAIFFLCNIVLIKGWKHYSYLMIKLFNSPPSVCMRYVLSKPNNM